MSTSLRRYTPLPFTQVRVDDEFWVPRLRTNRERSIPAVYRHLKATGRIDAFRLDWRPGEEPVPHIFWDSDVAKWLEGACYELARHPDDELEKLVNEVAALIASAQQPDGYLNVHYTVVEPEKRWTNLRDCHELYCAGHLIEAAIAHHKATGKRVLVDALCRYADYIGTVFGSEEGKQRGYCGHEEIELALIRLAHHTEQDRYLRLAQYFLEERGRRPSYFEEEMRARGEARAWAPLHYYQADVPVREQTEAVGHAVRAMYLYSAVADLAAEAEDTDLRAVCERLWQSATRRRMYVTGGVGSKSEGERFTEDYDLPNETAYAETCAAIGLAYFAHRMLQFDCDSQYADVMERALYNGVLSGVALEGERFFYVNPLESRGGHHRQDWFDCACCPTNVVRLLPTLGSYVYSTSDEGIAVHLYVGGEASLPIQQGAVKLGVTTRYPWEGDVRLSVQPTTPSEFTLRLRLPGWCRNWSLTVNKAPARVTLERGYACLRRTWSSGDRVDLELAMPVEQIAAHPAVAEDRGKLALQRGPIVYCLEGTDHEESVRGIAIRGEGEFVPVFQPDLLGGVVVLEGEGVAETAGAWEGVLYQPIGALRRQLPVRAVPYCTWDNRAPGEMVVWVARR